MSREHQNRSNPPSPALLKVLHPNFLVVRQESGLDDKLYNYDSGGKREVYYQAATLLRSGVYYELAFQTLKSPSMCCGYYKGCA